MEIVIATRNKGKLREFQALLGSGYTLLSLDDLAEIGEIKEDADTFAGNARKKAESVAKATGKIVIADDSGLEVYALGGQPGVMSARFAGRHGDDEANNKKLLKMMEDIPEDGRGARFVAAIAIAGPGFETRIAEGVCEGVIGFAPRGDGGFGYDPLFIVSEYGKTFAEMSDDLKNKISHRARALEKVRGLLKKIEAEIGR